MCCDLMAFLNCTGSMRIPKTSRSTQASNTEQVYPAYYYSINCTISYFFVPLSFYTALNFGSSLDFESNGKLSANMKVYQNIVVCWFAPYHIFLSLMWDSKIIFLICFCLVYFFFLSVFDVILLTLLGSILSAIEF